MQPSPSQQRSLACPLMCRRRVVRLAGGPPQAAAAAAAAADGEVPLEDRLQLTVDVERHMCGSSPWLVLHKMEPSWIRYVGQRVAACGNTAAAGG